VRTFFDVGGRTQEGGDWPDINGTAATLSTAAPRHARPLPDHLLFSCSDQNTSNEPGQRTRNISTARYKEVLAEYLEVLAAENTLLHIVQPTHRCSDSGFAIFRKRSAYQRPWRRLGATAGAVELSTTWTQVASGSTLTNAHRIRTSAASLIRSQIFLDPEFDETE